MDTIRNLLDSGLRAQNIDASEEQTGKLLNYLAMMKKWNQTHNLTAINTDSEMVILHLLDSLSILPHLREYQSRQQCLAPRIIDVGSGAGLPGIPLAIMQPHWAIDLLDARAKKVYFMNYVIHRLGLSSVKARQQRVESFHTEAAYDWILTRAFSSAADILVKCSHLCHAQSLFFAMKGKLDCSELQQIPQDYQLLETIALDVYRLEAQRHLLVMAKK